MSHVIALVDDDRNILTSVSIALQAESFLTRVYTDGQSALKEKYICLYTLRIKNSCWQTQDRMQITLLHQVSTDTLSIAIFKQNIVRQDNGSPGGKLILIFCLTQGTVNVL